MKDKLALSALIIATSCSAVVNDDSITGDPNATSIAIVDVNVVPMDRDRVLASQTVLIDSGRIVAIGPTATTTPPAGTLATESK